MNATHFFSSHYSKSDFREEQIVLYYFMIEAEVRWHHFRQSARAAS